MYNQIGTGIKSWMECFSLLKSNQDKIVLAHNDMTDYTSSIVDILLNF